MGDSMGMGRVDISARGQVVRGEHIELVLAAVPEQVWAWDEDMPQLDGAGGVFGVAVPMRLRREIIATVLATSQSLPL